MEGLTIPLGGQPLGLGPVQRFPFTSRSTKNRRERRTRGGRLKVRTQPRLLCAESLWLVLCAPATLVVWLSAGPLLGETLQGDVTRVLRNYGYGDSHVAIAVIDAKDRLRVGINETEPFKPASNMKILTSAAALYFLGADYEFRTELVATERVRGGQITGDLILRGTGDPNISGRFYDDDPLALLNKWAVELRRKLRLSRVTGDLIVDDSFFDDERFLPTWKRAQEGRWYSAQISPLSFNDNCVDIKIVPSSRVGERARIEMMPTCPAIQVTGAPRTVRGSVPRVMIRRTTGSNQIMISGKIGHKTRNFFDHVAVDDPALVFGSVFAAVLRQQGIEIHGEVRRVNAGLGFYHKNSPQKRLRTLPSEELLVAHSSSLLRDLPVVNKRSQNLHAEILLKSLGARVVGRGTTMDGAQTIHTFLKQKGIPKPRLEVHDGSGLSHANRTAALTLARTLRSVMSESYFETFRGSLAISGVDGTLKKRFKRFRHLRGKVHAKTGNIAGVSALSGYVDGATTTWCFSILVRNFPRKAKSHRDLQEKLVAVVAKAVP